MFPIIPHHIVKTVNPCEDKCFRISTFAARVRPSAGNFLPRNTPSKPYSIIQAPVDGRSCGFEVITMKGHLQPTEKSLGSTGGWIRLLQLSRDVHSGNVCLELTNGGSSVNIRCTRNISEGEDLQLWFSEEILAFMQIPFLSPGNIQGKRIGVRNCKSELILKFYWNQVRIATPATFASVSLRILIR